MGCVMLQLPVEFSSGERVESIPIMCLGNEIVVFLAICCLSVKVNLVPELCVLKRVRSQLHPTGYAIADHSETIKNYFAGEPENRVVPHVVKLSVSFFICNLFVFSCTRCYSYSYA